MDLMDIEISESTNISEIQLFCVNISTIADNLLEGDEEFDVIINGTDLTEVTVGEPNTTTVTILNGDGRFF